MRITQISLVCFVLLICRNGFSQDRLGQDNHKYLTYEAWELVKQVHPEVYNTEMNFRIGSNWNTGEINSYAGDFLTGKVITGAFREDETDIVYWYSDPWQWNTSSTHFWNADGGYDYSYEDPYFHVSHPNAFQKLTAYWTGKKDINKPWLELGPFAYYNVLFYIKIAYLNNDGSPATLDEAYKDKNKFKVVAWKQDGLKEWDDEPAPYMNVVDYLIKNQNNPHVPTETGIKEMMNKVCWEIVGRMCHLIEDSGVPAHAHNNSHVSGESYEHQYMPSNYNLYNVNTAIQQAALYNQPLLFNLMNKNNPILYDIYITNQIADRFASDGCPFPIGGCGTTFGNTIYSNYTPTVPGETSDFVSDIISPIYAHVASVPTSPPYITTNYCQVVAENSFNFSMRTVGSFLWYIFQKFNIQTYPTPAIYITCTSPDNSIYKGETVTFSTPFHTAGVWSATVCSSDGCETPVPGMTISKDFTKLQITNQNYQALTCRFCDPTRSTDIALYYKVKFQYTNQFGNVINFYYPPQNSGGVTPIQIQRPFGGCPFVYVQNDSGKFIAENNILHKSEFSENIGQEISDRYKLNVHPGVSDSKINLNLFESTNDISSINSIKLLAVDHPVGTKIGVTENNDIIMYYEADVSDPKKANKNHIEDITSLIHYDNTNGGGINDTVSGISNDSVFADYDLATISNKIQLSRNKFIFKNKGIFADNTALIFKIGRNPVIIPPPSKRPAGFVNISTDAVSISEPFARRELPSDVIIPIGQDASIQSADIKWNRDYQLYFASVVDIFYSGFDVTELPLTSAISSFDGNDLLPDLQSIDGDYATLDTSGIISLSFSDVKNNSGMIRDYVLETNGQYSAGGTKNKTVGISGKNTRSVQNANVLTNKLNVNFPNPFNPTTKINYQIASNSFVSLKVYNVLGQLMSELVSEFKIAGDYTVEFNGSNLSTGVYYYRIETKDFVETKRMMLIK